MHTKFWLGTQKGKTLGRRRCRWEDNVRSRGDWIHLTLDRGQCQALVNKVMNLSGSIRGWKFD
jgi:hypothetical protein